MRTPAGWCLSLCAFYLVLLRPFSSPRIESFTLEVTTETLNSGKEASGPKILDVCLQCEWFYSPELVKPLAREEGRRDGGIIQTESWFSSKVIWGHYPGKTINFSWPAHLPLCVQLELIVAGDQRLAGSVHKPLPTLVANCHVSSWGNPLNNEREAWTRFGLRVTY